MFLMIECVYVKPKIFIFCETSALRKRDSVQNTGPIWGFENCEKTTMSFVYSSASFRLTL